MNQPPMDVLREVVDSRYTLVVLAAKRARQLLEGAPPQVEVDSEKPVTVALQEVAAGQIKWERATK
ncbi:MAG TPA: DNA-directed RNA polymerase subunit omega [Firmicutes bacterium]|nr:DNA-directed RNA polymerase subunit omega [Bacillota bacterium]